METATRPYAFSRKVFCEGMRDGVPIALGYFAVSFSLGIAARSAGLTPIQGFIASLFNNASAGAPADMPSDTIDELIYQLLQTFAHVSAADLRRQRIAAELARSGARPMGSCTSQEEAERLLERLQEAGDRCFSPAGKPILAEITLDELRAKLR